MGLHQPDESFGLGVIDDQVCHFCDSKPIAVMLDPGTDPTFLWACQDHADQLSAQGRHLWVIRRTCQVVQNDTPCGGIAHWIEFVGTGHKIQPASLCRRCAEETRGVT